MTAMKGGNEQNEQNADNWYLSVWENIGKSDMICSYYEKCISELKLCVKECVYSSRLCLRNVQN